MLIYVQRYSIRWSAEKKAVGKDDILEVHVSAFRPYFVGNHLAL